MARTPRKWQGARNPSGLKRVRQAERRHAILQPRRSAAKTLVAKAVTVATAQPESADVADHAERGHLGPRPRRQVGAIHPNAAARRKSRLTRRSTPPWWRGRRGAGHVAKSTGKAAAAKAAKARIAAGKAVKAKGAQTAAGKARAALSKTTRAEAAPAAAPVAEAPAAKTTGRRPRRRPPKTTRPSRAAKTPPRPRRRRPRPSRAAKSHAATPAPRPAKPAAAKAAPKTDEGRRSPRVLAPRPPNAPVADRGVFDSADLRPVAAQAHAGPPPAVRPPGGSGARWRSRSQRGMAPRARSGPPHTSVARGRLRAVHVRGARVARLRTRRPDAVSAAGPRRRAAATEGCADATRTSTATAGCAA